MKNFKEFEVKRLEDVVGGVNIRIVISNILDGIKGNGDIRIERDLVVSK